jgi:hypothetical protein
MDRQRALREALSRLRYADFLTGWRLAEKRTSAALANWRAAPLAAKADAYAGYLAALDDEAQAAKLLQAAAA